MKVTTGEHAAKVTATEAPKPANPAPESGVHPTARCLAAGEDLRAALLLVRDGSATSQRPPAREAAPKAPQPTPAKSTRRARRDDQGRRGR